MPKSKINIELKDVDFKGLAKKEKNPRIRVRLLGLMQLQQGASINAVAKMFGVRWKTVKRWLVKFSNFGLNGLGDKHRSGRKPYLKTENIEEFKNAVEKLQSKRQGGRIIAKDIQKLLNKQFQAKYDLDSIYKILKKVGMVWITARSIHPQANYEAQEAFKKTLPKK